MTKFKVGDKIRRLESKQVDWWNNMCTIAGCEPTAIFEVSVIEDDNFIRLKEFIPNSEFDSERFELVDCVPLPENLRLKHAPWCNWITSNQATKCSCPNLQQPIVLDDGIKQPSHYMLFDDIEAIEVIAHSMTVEQFKGYCLGNIIKYRLRAGKKSELATLEKDLAKADFYQELFDKHKSKCYGRTTGATTKELKD